LLGGVGGTAGAVGAGVVATGAGGAGAAAAGAGAGAGAAVVGAGVALPELSTVAAAGALVIPARRARKRSNKRACANCDMSMKATKAMRRIFRISLLLT